LDPSPDRESNRTGAGSERDAYGELVSAHSRRVFAVCLGMVGTFEDAEDMAQETFIRGYRRLGELRDREKFGAWIVQIARNACHDHLRRSKRIRDKQHQIPQRLVVDAEDHDLRDAVARLPEDYRLPLVLYYFDGHSTESVAATLGLSPAGVATRLCRARRELRRMLSGEEAGDA